MKLKFTREMRKLKANKEDMKTILTISVFLKYKVNLGCERWERYPLMDDLLMKLGEDFVEYDWRRINGRWYIDLAYTICQGDIEKYQILLDNRRAMFINLVEHETITL